MLGQHKRKPEFPVITRESRHISRKTTCFARHRMKAQHEGALPPPCIVRKDPRVPHTARRKRWEPRGFSRVAAGFSSYDGEFRLLLLLAQEVQSCIRVARESWGLLSSHFRAKSPHLGLGPGRSVPLQGLHSLESNPVSSLQTPEEV